ncbi:uncharacterized protein LOC123654322 isoform X2 [Melitaea cinxia]|uniref:uncharacterized protein LOC123654322 isoform X2 n=1 Tax=Melitaea cinxia TaxID=113334 RepID=UPI001E273090|nr:uncharacterized protein LOC123654322 isoform X2 [Melitaea cinxia]
MDVKSSISRQEWHIPRPSLATNNGSINDSSSRGGSASSQGSSSNHSTHSVSSGSLLLSAANLARMSGRNTVQEECYQIQPQSIKLGSQSKAVISIPEESSETTDKFWSDVKRGSLPGPDATSVASSTHFTVVNGFTKHRPSKEPKSCCCDHSHQITVLVISMTILFSACILAAICFVEMRMRRETGMYKYS